MQSRWLKPLRATVACLVLAAVLAAFADFRGQFPSALAHGLASTQFVPSMIALVTGASIALAGLIILVITLLVGRIYCSAICPLGIFQDAISRIARWLPGKRKRLPYSQKHTRFQLVFFGISVAGILVGWAGFTLSLLDPYSVFGKIASSLVRPIVTLINNSLVGVANVMGIDAMYRVDPQWAGAGALALPLLMFIVIFILAFFRGRLYCNTICPVGTLLGFLSKWSVLRLEIDKDRCHKCANCLQVCKAQCIDLKNGTIDFTRCVDCFNCVGTCTQNAIGFKSGWKKTPVTKPATTDTQSSTEVPNLQRRKFVADAVIFTGLLGTGLGVAEKSKKRLPITPPGSSSVERFLNRCTACQLCISACPSHVLKPAFLEYGLLGMMKPRMDYNYSFCNYDCTECGQVCPDGAISELVLEKKQVTRIGSAHLDLTKCVVKVKGKDCAACSEHCPTKAVNTIPYGNNLRLPEVNDDLCIGCGACQYACPEAAITVEGLPVHEQAMREVEKKAEKPKMSGDFPF